MGSVWITLGLFSIITTWESAAITNRRPQQQLESAVRNFRHIDAYSSHQHVDWEVGLREAANQALLRERYQDYHLRDRLLEAPLIGRQEAPTPFGDILVLARGQLYATDEGHFIFVQDPYQNDCDDCHNARNRCRSSQCKLWKPHDDQHLLALWTVKRIRHRDYNNIHRYELEYTISPITPTLQQQFLIRNGHYDYGVPGHVFVVKHHDLTMQPIDVYPTVVHKRRTPHHRFNPQVLIGVDPDGRKHFLHSYPGFYPSTPVHTTHMHHIPSTNDPEEVELYKQLLETLAAKTSTTQGGKNSHPTFSLNQFDKSTNKMYATKPAKTTPVRFPTTVHQDTSSNVLFSTQPMKEFGNQNTQYSPESTKDVSTTIHYFTPIGEEQLITGDEVEKMVVPVDSKGTTSVPFTEEIDGLNFLFPTVQKITTPSKTTNLPTLNTKYSDSADFLFPDEQKRPTIHLQSSTVKFTTPKTTTNITSSYYNLSTSPESPQEDKTTKIASSTPKSTTDIDTSEPTQKSTTISSNTVNLTTSKPTVSESIREYHKSTSSATNYVDQKEKDVILQQEVTSTTISSSTVTSTTPKSTILNTEKTTETSLLPQEEKTSPSSSTTNKLSTPKAAVDQITSKSTTKYYKPSSTKATESVDHEETEFLSSKEEKDTTEQIPSTTTKSATSKSTTKSKPTTVTTAAEQKEEKTTARPLPSKQFTTPKSTQITKITSSSSTKYYKPMKSKPTKTNTDERVSPSPKEILRKTTTTTTSTTMSLAPTKPDDFLSAVEEKNYEKPAPSTRNKFTTTQPSKGGISSSKLTNKYLKPTPNSKSTVEENNLLSPKEKTTSTQLSSTPKSTTDSTTSRSTKKYSKPTLETDFPSSEENSPIPLSSTKTMPTASISTSTKYHKPSSPNTESTKSTTIKNDLPSPEEEKQENKSTTSKPYHKTSPKYTESEENENKSILSEETTLRFITSTPRSTTINTTKRRFGTSKPTTVKPKTTTFKVITPASTRFIRPRPFTKPKSTTPTSKVAPKNISPQPTTPIKFAAAKSTTVKSTTVKKLTPKYTQTFTPLLEEETNDSVYSEVAPTKAMTAKPLKTLPESMTDQLQSTTIKKLTPKYTQTFTPLLVEETNDSVYSEVAPTKAMTAKPLKTQPESIKNQLQPPGEDTDSTVPYTSLAATQKTEESTIDEAKTTEEIHETTTVLPTINTVTKATEIPTWITETKTTSANPSKATVNNFTTIEQYMETDITSMDHIVTTIKMNGTHYMQTTTFKATKPTFTTTGVKPPTFDDFLRGNGKEPTHTNKNYDEDDIFGSQKMETTTETATKVIKQSEIADELFVTKERSGKQLKTDTSTLKVIYSDFYEASTPSVKAFETTLQFQPPTSQTYANTISFQVNKKNKTERDGETSTVATEMTTEGDRYTTYETEPPTQINEDTTSNVKHATKRAFDQAALQLVNHARTIDYLSRSRNRTTKVKYKRRRTYTPKTRTSTRRKQEKKS